MELSFKFMEKKDKPITEEEISGFLSHIDINREKLFITTIVQTGIDARDLANVRWTAIDFLNKIFQIHTKRNGLRIIYLPKALLEQYQAVKQEDGMPFGYSDYILSQMLKRYTIRYFGERRTWRDLRLSYLLISKKHNVPFEVVCNNMGVNPDSILKYWQKSPNDYRNAVEWNL